MTMTARPLAGSLRQIALADVLHVIETERRSGVLTVVSTNLRADIFFSSGQWVNAVRSGDDMPLVAMLARDGVIRPGSFEMATGLPAARMQAISDLDTLQMLAASDMITQEQLVSWAFSDACQLLWVLLRWSDGEFRFSEGVALPAGRVAIPLAVGALLTSVIAAFSTPGVAGSGPYAVPPMASGARVPAPALQYGAGPAASAPGYAAPAPGWLSPGSIIDFAAVPPSAPGMVEVSPDEWRVLALVDGWMPLHAIAETLGAPEPAILQIVSGLLTRGLIGICDEVNGPGELGEPVYRP